MATKIIHYDVGDVWTPQATFSISGVNTDPTTLTVTQQAADGTETVLANAVSVAGLNSSSTPVAKTATGIFKLNPGISLTTPGYWFVKFTGTGTAAASETQEAIVDPDEFSTDTALTTSALVSLPEARDWLQQTDAQWSGDTLELARVINDISDRFQEEAGREFKAFGTQPATRDFELHGWHWYEREVSVGDMTSVTSASIVAFDFDGAVADTLSLSNLILKPRVRRSWQPITSIQFALSVVPTWLHYRAVLRVTGTYGFPAIPGSVRQAVLEEISAVLDRNVEHYSQDLGTSEGGGEQNVIIQRQGPVLILPLMPRTLAVAQSFRTPVLV